LSCVSQLSQVAAFQVKTVLNQTIIFAETREDICTVSEFAINLTVIKPIMCCYHQQYTKAGHAAVMVFLNDNMNVI